MPDWKSRLEVHVGGVVVSPITKFTTAFTSGITPIHSIEADNVGVIKKPQTMTFSMTVPASGTDPTFENAAGLYRLAVLGLPFEVALVVRSGPDWSFKSLLFSECFITSANPSDITVPAATTTGVLDTMPVATFSGIIKKFVGPDGSFLTVG
jgi:hypothetical protein